MSSYLLNLILCEGGLNIDRILFLKSPDVTKFGHIIIQIFSTSLINYIRSPITNKSSMQFDIKKYFFHFAVINLKFAPISSKKKIEWFICNNIFANPKNQNATIQPHWKNKMKSYRFLKWPNSQIKKIVSTQVGIKCHQI